MSLSSSGLPAEVLTSQGGFASEPISCVRKRASVMWSPHLLSNVGGGSSRGERRFPLRMEQRRGMYGPLRSRGHLQGGRLCLSEPLELLPRDLLRNVLKVSVRDKRHALGAAGELLGERRDLLRILEARAPRVDDAGERELVRLREIAELRGVEVDPNPLDREVGQAAGEERPRIAERALEHKGSSGGGAAKGFERGREVVEARLVLAGEEGLAEHDEVGVESLELGPEHALGEHKGWKPRSLRERERRGKRRKPRPRKRRDIALIERLAELRLCVRHLGSAVEGVRVEEARQGARFEALARLDQRAEEVLPAKHPVGKQVQARLLLDGDKLLEVKVDLLVHRLNGCPAPVEIARGLHERLRTGIDAWSESLHRSGACQDLELVLRVPDPLLELPAVGFGLARLQAFQLSLGGLELLPGPVRVDLLRRDGVVHQRDRSILLDLEEPGAGGELQHLGGPEVNAGRARLQHRDERRMACEHADLAVGARHNEHLGLAFERRPFRRHERDRESTSIRHRLDGGRLGLAGFFLGRGGFFLRCLSGALVACQRPRLLDGLVDRAHHVEGLFGELVVLALDDLLEALDRVLELHVLTLLARELLGHEVRLGEEALDAASAVDRQLVLVRELVDPEDGDDVLQVLVALEDLLYARRGLVVLLGDDARLHGPREGREWVHRGIDPHLDDRTLEIHGRVEVGKGVCGGGVRVVVRRHEDGLNRSHRPGLGGRDPLLQLAHLGCERRLVADRARHPAEERGNLRTGLDETEDVVDEEENVLPLVAEVLGHRQPEQADAQARPRGLVHLPVAERDLLDHARLLHLQPQVVALACPLAHAREDRDAAVLHRNVVDQLLDEDGLADPGAAEQADLAAPDEGGDQVDDLHSGLEHLDVRLELVEVRRVTMDRPALAGRRLLVVDRLADDDPKATECLVAHGNRDRIARVDDIHSARKAVGGIHRHSADTIVSEMLLDLGDQVDLRQPLCEDGVDDDALDLDYLADVVGAVLFLLFGHASPREVGSRRRLIPRRRASARSLAKRRRRGTPQRRASSIAATRAAWSRLQTYEVTGEASTTRTVLLPALPLLQFYDRADRPLRAGFDRPDLLLMQR